MVKKQRHRKQVSICTFCAGIMTTIVVASAFTFLYHHKVQSAVREQLYQEIKEENETAVNDFKAAFAEEIEKIELAAELSGALDADMPEGRWVLVDKLAGDAQKIGVADESGRLYFGAGQYTDVDGNEYYRQTMQGGACTGLAQEVGADGKRDIVIAAPIRQPDGTPCGAVMAVYDAGELGASLSRSFQRGTGADILIDAQGNVLAAGKEAEAFGNLYDQLNDVKCKDGGTVETMRAQVENGKSGYLAYSRNDEDQLLYYQPVGAEDWTMVSWRRIGKAETALTQLLRTNSWYIGIMSIIFAVGALLTVAIGRYRNELFKLSTTDEVTGVFTRAAGQLLVTRRLSGKQGHRCYGCLFIDMDNFKAVNDTYGHDRGDEVLRQTGNLLRSAVREQDVVCRYGGDEFCIWLFGNGGRDEVENIAKRILEKAEEQGAFHLSIGASIVSADEKDHDAIVKRADDAVYLAKRKGKNQLAFYSPAVAGEVCAE